MAMYHDIKEIVLLRKLLEDMGAEQEGPTPLFSDSEAAIGMANNPILNGLKKHMKIKWHWVRQMVKEGIVELHHVKASKQAADFLTKRLPESAHWKSAPLVRPVTAPSRPVRPLHGLSRPLRGPPRPFPSPVPALPRPQPCPGPAPTPALPQPCRGPVPDLPRPRPYPGPVVAPSRTYPDPVAALSQTCRGIAPTLPRLSPGPTPALPLPCSYTIAALPRPGPGSSAARPRPYPGPVAVLPRPSPGRAPASPLVSTPPSRAALPSRNVPPSRAALSSRPTNVLTFDAEGRAVDFEVWLDDPQLFLQCDSKDGLSLFDLTSGASTAPAADADSTVRSQWTTRDAAARLAVRSHLPSIERAHLSQYKSAKTLYDVVVARYSSPATAALSRLMLPYLFPGLAAFAIVADLVAHFLSLCPTELTVDLLEERLAAAEKSILAVGASHGDRRTPFFEGCSPVPLLPSVASADAVDLVGTE
ncbi:unnamed protein product, partial [Closterium sp. NIES-53]